MCYFACHLTKSIYEGGYCDRVQVWREMTGGERGRARGMYALEVVQDSDGVDLPRLWDLHLRVLLVDHLDVLHQVLLLGIIYTHIAIQNVAHRASNKRSS